MGKWYVGATAKHAHKIFDLAEDYKVCDCGDTDDGRKRAVEIVIAHNRDRDLERIAELASKIDVVWEDDEAHDPGEWDELLTNLRQALRPWRARRAGDAALAEFARETGSAVDGEAKP